MEQLFTPARRLQHEEIYEGAHDEDDEPLPFDFTEVQLAVPVEVFLNQIFLRGYSVSGTV
jgi:hypothetical protein